MAATDDGAQRRPLRHGALSALTAAALALPGLTPAVGHAADDNAAETQFGHFREGERTLFGLKSKFQPIEADSLSSSFRLFLTDRLKAVFNFRQDTWSGATPIATAPREWRGNRTNAPDGVSGASPFLVPGSALFLDAASLQPLRTDGFGTLTGGVDSQLVHTLSGASRETRKQLDVRLSREWDETTLSLGAGVSRENDYLSRFGNIGGRWDFDRKRTSLGLDLTYSASNTTATLDHDAVPYIYDTCGDARCNFTSTSSRIENLPGGKKILHGDRRDWTAELALGRILSRDAQVEGRLGFTRSTGYLSNPYKVVEVAFVDPDQQFLAPSPDVLVISVNSLLEQRPDERKQLRWDLRYVQHVDATDGALHLSYRHFRDDWGIRSHTLEAEWAQPLGGGWTLTPRLRYYTQSAANFYTPYLVTNQAQNPNVIDPVRGQAFVDANDPGNGQIYFDDPNLATPDGFNPLTGNPVVDASGNPVSQAVADSLINLTTPFDRSKLPRHYSSDHRLAGYGAVSGGISIVKEFARGVTLELGYEHYRRGSKWRLGGGGSGGSYADFNYDLFSAAFKVDFDGAGAPRRERSTGPTGGGHPDHPEHRDHVHGIPAGVMFAHSPGEAGEWMLGYRYMHGRQAGSVLHGAGSVSDEQVKLQACRGTSCPAVASSMHMNMHMLELMYAPTDWLSLMLMAQYVDMNMNMRGLLNEGELAALPPETNNVLQHHLLHEHTTGGIGDTGAYATFKVMERSDQRLLATVGVTAPTGDVGVKLRDTHQVDAGFHHYGMQLGSGTWDLNPSVTYLGEAGRISWGAQLSGTLRMENRNRSGYALGNVVQATAWGGYALPGGISATVRGVYTRQGAIRNEFSGTLNKLSPADFPDNYGGRYWDLGLGLAYAPGGGALAGNRFALEWMIPVKDDVNGYQIDRRGSWVANWQYAF